jgi:hypothetical protein
MILRDSRLGGDIADEGLGMWRKVPIVEFPTSSAHLSGPLPAPGGQGCLRNVSGP